VVGIMFVVVPVECQRATLLFRMVIRESTGSCYRWFLPVNLRHWAE
jgi:hypothetical protein